MSVVGALLSYFGPTGTDLLAGDLLVGWEFVCLRHWIIYEPSPSGGAGTDHVGLSQCLFNIGNIDCLTEYGKIGKCQFSMI